MPDLTPEIIANTVRAAQKAKAHELALATDPLSVLEQAVQWERDQVIGLSSCVKDYGEPCDLCEEQVDALIATVRAHERARSRQAVEGTFWAEDETWVRRSDALAALDALDATP